MEQTENQPKGVTSTRFMVEWLLLTAVVAVSYLVLGVETGALAVIGVAVAYVLYFLWRDIVGYLKRRKASGADGRTAFYVGMYWGSGGIAASILCLAAIPAWVLIAFDTERLGVDLSLFWLIVPVVFLPAFPYLLGLLMLRRRGVISGSLSGFVRADIARLARSPLVPTFALAMALVALLSTMASAFAMEGLVKTLTQNSDAGFLDIAAMFPAIPLGLLASTALLTIARTRWTAGGDTVVLILAHLERRIRPPAWPAVVTAGASVVAVIAVLNPIHIGLIGALGAVSGIAPWSETSRAVESWIAARRDEGLGAAEIAESLTRQGKWTPDAPKAGLAALMPGLGAELSKHDMCRITVAAGPADPSAVAGKGWIPAETAGSDIKYCLRVSCPSPLSWQAPPALLMTSSHPSRNREWAATSYIDIFARGAAVEPGGYCTADGRLAKDFRG